MITVQEKNNIPKILANLKNFNGSVDVGIFSSSGSELVEIANVHEFGASIVPKNKKWLTIPLRKELKDKKATDFKLEFLLPKNSGGKYALLVKREGKSIVPYYLLLRKVVIPERAFLRKTADDPKTIQRIEKVINKFLSKIDLQNISSESFFGVIGEEFISAVKEKINNREFANNFPITINIKGGKPPLYDTGRLRDAITYKINQ